MSNLISDKSAREHRNLEKMAIVIRFLKQEVYTNLETLMLLLGYKKRPPLDRLLNKLIALEYIQKHVYEFPTGKISIWGITDLGLAQELEETDRDFQAFEPYRVKFQTLNHRLLNQRVRIYLERQGWEGWHNGDRYSFREKYDVENRPDAVIKSPNGHLIAIETERTIKNLSRYRAIFKSHIIAKQKQYWSAVFYIVPDEKMKAVLNKRFDQIEYVQFDESRHKFEDYRKKIVRVFTVEELQHLTAN
ncbi:MobC family replication-relaxation protein [Vibrio europaeus]|uniref:MobC family replication-relaxation protein n=1 Tax=Vibrio europaeus TaxID=300876 RepID=UPI00233EAE8C|nr:MobC family replication-relaxation protein [Vibrio europaeus]MDC5711141.1 mobilization protein [Vibrio europaeus]MDC5713170.1 mobilization protein [Vibrio europaeus]